MAEKRMKPSKDAPTRVQVRNPHRRPGEGMTEAETRAREMGKAGTPQERIVYSRRHYEYTSPFNYPNVNCEIGREGTGTGPHPDGMELDIPPFGAITIAEDEPIIGVTVIGSPCTPPGTIWVFGEPVEYQYARSGVKFKRPNLWGEHLYGWEPGTPFDEGNRHAGLCSAHFDIPDCTKVTIMGAGQLDVIIGSNEHLDNPLEELGEWWNDAHFNIRTIRITVRIEEGE